MEEIVRQINKDGGVELHKNEKLQYFGYVMENEKYRVIKANYYR